MEILLSYCTFLTKPINQAAMKMTITEKATQTESMLFEECSNNILKNLEKAIDRQKEPPNRISELLAMKWYIENGLKVETN